MVFPAAGGVVLVLVLVLVLVDVGVCSAVPPLVEPVLGVEEVVVAELLVVVAALVAALVVAVCVVTVVDPVDPVAGAVPLVPVGPRLSVGLVIVGMMIGELAGASSAIFAPPHAASARPHTITAPARRGLIPTAAASDGRRSGSR